MLYFAASISGNDHQMFDVVHRLQMVDEWLPLFARPVMKLNQSSHAIVDDNDALHAGCLRRKPFKHLGG